MLQELHAAMAAWAGCPGNSEGVFLQRPSDFLRTAAEGISSPLRVPKQRRATRVRALAQNQAWAAADPGKWFAKRDIQAALPPCENVRGFCLARAESLDSELATCLFLHHEQNPLFLEHAVCCIYADDLEVETLIQRCGQHALPVFWGQGGGAVMQEYLGSFEIVEVLRSDHALHEASALFDHLDGLRRRSRRPMIGPQLLQMKRVELASLG
ncbi:unnamed protein product, partial [Symbiodinium pilosum]